MAKTKSRTEQCLYCNHFGFCLIPWGTKCKRQGGKKIPCVKSMPFELRPKGKKKQQKPNNKIIKISESIRTKKTIWG